MASTAWTATREELVRELAQTRGRLAVLAAREAERKADQRERKAQQRERDRQRKADAALLDQANAVAAARTTPPDPNAAQHRRTLIAALKEKP